MRQVLFDLDLDFADEAVRRRNENRLLLLLEALTQFDLDFLEDHPNTPHLYDLEVCYKRPEQMDRKLTDSQIKALQQFLKSTMKMGDSEITHHIDLARGIEMFRSASRVIENGGGDCDNWSPWRTAELRRAGWRGVRPGLVARTIDGRIIMHTVTVYPDGTDEDPSLILGMGGAGRFQDRLNEFKKNYERHDGLMAQGRDLVDLKRQDGDNENELRAYAARVQAKIDAFGLLPKDGIWRYIGNEPAGVANGVVRWVA